MTADVRRPRVILSQGYRGRAARRGLLPALALLGLTSGCVSPRGMAPPATAGVAAVDPIAFFAGRTHGTGVLHIVASKARTTDVVGHGTRDGADAITLEQDVVQGGRAATHRIWQLRRVGPGSYAGTLTDAAGAVTARVDGAALVIRFGMRHGLRVVQRLYLQPGGRVALNTMTVRKWGIVVARLDERIERL